MTVIFIT